MKDTLLPGTNVDAVPVNDSGNDVVLIDQDVLSAEIGVKQKKWRTIDEHYRGE
jgi:hypothetical protein